MSIYPDRRWLTKQYIVLGTIGLLLALCSGVAHLLVAVVGNDVDMGTFAAILWGVSGGLIVLMFVISVPVVVLWFRNLEYMIESDKVIIRKGVLTKIQQNIPLAMVTDFRLHRTLYDRALGIGSIQVQTAGQSMNATGYEGKLAGLTEWAELHEELRKRIRRSERTTSADEDSDLHAILAEVREIRRVLATNR